MKARVGGAAQLASALVEARRSNPNTITVAAGDLIGASPLASAYFLDEPTVDAMNLLGLSLASVGNHEFDKGSAELLRMQKGGCEKYTTRVPCRLEPFAGARFQYLAANVVRSDGSTIFPATAIRQVGPIKIGFIGETLKETQTLVSPGGVAGLEFKDEASVANALVPQLKAQGADAIVLLIHQGGEVPTLTRSRAARFCRRHPADPRQARPRDHDRHLGPHAQCLFVHAAARRCRAASDQRRQIWLSCTPTSAWASIRRRTS